MVILYRYKSTKNNTTSDTIPTTPTTLPSTIKSKLKGAKDLPTIPSKVLYKKDASIYNPYESFCNILFNVTIRDKLIDIA